MERMIVMNIPYVFKRCSKCGEWLVASKVNFYKNKLGKYGLKSKCKKCIAEQHKQYYDDNKNKIAKMREAVAKRLPAFFCAVAVAVQGVQAAQNQDVCQDVFSML